MGHAVQSGCLRQGKDIGKVLCGMIYLSATQAKPNDSPVLGADRPLGYLVARIGVVADDVQDPAEVNAKIDAGASPTGVQASKDLVKGQAGIRYVGVGRESHFAVADILAVHVGAEFIGDERKIVHRPEAAGDGKIDADKMGEICKPVEVAQAIQVAGGQVNLIALGENQQGRGPDATLEMYVKFYLWHFPDEVLDGHRFIFSK
jgi:hypothetical protein